MKRIILSRLQALIDSHGSTGSYQSLLSGNGWALVLIRTRDPQIRTEDWTRKPGE